MSNKRYTDEFRAEAVKRVTERGQNVAIVAARLDVSTHSLYQWMQRFGAVRSERNSSEGQRSEIRRFKAELKRVSEERDILKKATTYYRSWPND